MSGESETEEWWFDVRPKGVERGGHARSMTSFPRVLSRAAHPMKRRPDDTKHSRHVLAASQPTCRKSRLPGGGPMHGKVIHRCPHSKCRSGGRPCFAWHLRDARDAGGSLVGHEHERVCRRTTDQRLVGAVTGDQSTDSPLEADIDVRVTSQPVFSWAGGWCSCTCKPGTGNVGGPSPCSPQAPARQRLSLLVFSFQPSSMR